MRAMLVNPAKVIDANYDYIKSYHPLFAQQLSAYLKDSNHDVELLDVFAEGFSERKPISNYLRVGLSKNNISDRIASYGPDIVFVSSTFTHQYLQTVEICDIVKGLDRGIKTVVGGIHITGIEKCSEEGKRDFERLNKKSGIAEENIDHKVIGPGEIPAQQIADMYKNGRVPDEKIISEHFDLSGSLDPDFAIYQKRKYDYSSFHTISEKGSHVIPYLGSRACPNNCKYCCTPMMWGNRFTHYTEKQISRHIDSLIELGYDEIAIHDDNLLADKNYALGLLNNIRMPNWTLIAADRSLIDEEIKNLLIDNNCSRICLAIESPDGNKHVGMGKNTYRKASQEHAISLVKDFSSAGIELELDFMVGFPGETSKEIENTLHFAEDVKNLSPDKIFPCFNIVTAFPGTAFYEEIRHEIDWSKGYSGFTLRQKNLLFQEFDEGINKYMLDHEKERGL